VWYSSFILGDALAALSLIFGGVFSMFLSVWPLPFIHRHMRYCTRRANAGDCRTAAYPATGSPLQKTDLLQ
jgi:hypothetical protein